MTVRRRALEASTTTKMAAADAIVFILPHIRSMVAIGRSISAEIYLYGGVAYLKSK